jgi:hypothetical protein
MGLKALKQQHQALAALGPIEPMKPKAYKPALTQTASTGIAIEVALATEAVLNEIAQPRIFPQKISNQLHEAYKSQYPGEEAKMSLGDKLEDLLETGGPKSVEGTIQGIKGKLFEIKLPEILEDRFPGSKDWTISKLANQKGWDLKGTLADETEILVQAKARGISAAADVIQRMEAENAPEYFALTDELAKKIQALRPDLAGKIIKTDLTEMELNEEASEALSTITEELGLPMPDALTEGLPMIGEVILGIRLIKLLANGEKTLKGMPKGDKNRVQAVRSLALMARFGFVAVCTTAGAAGGATIEPLFPTGIPTIGGAITGALLGRKLHKKVEPKLLGFGLDLAGVNRDDLFYYQNKTPINQVGLRLRQQATELKSLLPASV